MKILHVITNMGIGGAERLMVDLLPRLRDMGHVVELLLFNGVDTPFRQNLAKQGIKIYELFDSHNVKENSRVYSPMNVVKLKKFIQGYDIIHTHNTACQCYVPIAKKLFGIKTTLVTTEHNATNKRRNIWWFKFFDRWIYNQYSAIVCISSQTRSNLVEYYCDKDIISTIYNGVDISRFVRPVRNIEHNKNYVLTMVAAFRTQKDYETLLKAMVLLPECYHLQIVGTGLREEEIKQQSQSLGLDSKVEFLGMRQDVPDILEQSDIIVLSSHWEGLSLSSIEGMASGRPFVASDVDGLHEMVDGAGVLFEHGNEKDLAEKIQWLCEHPDEYSKVAQRCQERARQFDISVMAEEYNKLYESLLTEDNGLK